MTHRSPIFEISDVYIDQEAALSPMSCTYLGNGLNQDKLDDFSIAAAEVSANLTRETLKKLDSLEPIDEIDRIAKAVMKERLESGLAPSRQQRVICTLECFNISTFKCAFNL
jgi:uncharacterized protein (DUF885 family)